MSGHNGYGRSEAEKVIKMAGACGQRELAGYLGFEMKTEVTHDSFPGHKWLGYHDSREYFGDSDDDYCFKHFFLRHGDDELCLTITDETMGERNGHGGFWGQSEGECNWPCHSQEDMDILEKILIKSLGKLHLPTER